MKKNIAFTLLALLSAGVAYAAGADLGQAEKQATNWTAIGMFAVFVAGTLWITKWAAAKTRSACWISFSVGEKISFTNRTWRGLITDFPSNPSPFSSA